MKSAVVVPCSSGYLYGLNSIINALEIYHNTADVHVIWYYDRRNETDPITKSFFDQLKTAKFGFDIKVINVMDIFGSDYYNPKPGWMLRFARWRYTKNLADQGYDAVCHLGADVMVWDNIMNWMEVAAKTDIVVTGRNALGDYGFHSDTIIHTNNAPYADVPCFANPARNYECFERIYKIACTMAIGDMPAFYFAMKEYNKKVILLPDILWIRNIRQADYISESGRKIAGDYPFLTSSVTKQRISMVHGKFWSRLRVNKQINAVKGAENAPLWVHNLELCYKMMKYFNTHGIIKLEWNPNI